MPVFAVFYFVFFSCTGIHVQFILGCPIPDDSRICTSAVEFSEAMKLVDCLLKTFLQCIYCLLRKRTGSVKQQF